MYYLNCYSEIGSFEKLLFKIERYFPCANKIYYIKKMKFHHILNNYPEIELATFFSIYKE